MRASVFSSAATASQPTYKSPAYAMADPRPPDPPPPPEPEPESESDDELEDGRMLGDHSGIARLPLATEESLKFAKEELILLASCQFTLPIGDPELGESKISRRVSAPAGQSDLGLAKCSITPLGLDALFCKKFTGVDGVVAGTLRRLLSGDILRQITVDDIRKGIRHWMKDIKGEFSERTTAGSIKTALSAQKNIGYRLVDLPAINRFIGKWEAGWTFNAENPGGIEPDESEDSEESESEESESDDDDDDDAPADDGSADDGPADSPAGGGPDDSQGGLIQMIQGGLIQMIRRIDSDDVQEEDDMPCGYCGVAESVGPPSGITCATPHYEHMELGEGPHGPNYSSHVDLCDNCIRKIGEQYLCPQCGERAAAVSKPAAEQQQQQEDDDSEDDSGDDSYDDDSDDSDEQDDSAAPAALAAPAGTIIASAELTLAASAVSQKVSSLEEELENRAEEWAKLEKRTEELEKRAEEPEKNLAVAVNGALEQLEQLKRRAEESEKELKKLKKRLKKLEPTEPAAEQ